MNFSLTLFLMVVQGSVTISSQIITTKKNVSVTGMLMLFVTSPNIAAKHSYAGFNLVGTLAQQHFGVKSKSE